MGPDNDRIVKYAEQYYKWLIPEVVRKGKDPADILSKNEINLLCWCACDFARVEQSFGLTKEYREVREQELKHEWEMSRARSAHRGSMRRIKQLLEDYSPYWDVRWRLGKADPPQEILTDITWEWLAELRFDTKICPLCSCIMVRNGREAHGKTLDHIVPINIGGLHTKDNVRFICKRCNLGRSKLDGLYTGEEQKWLKKK